MKLAHFHIAVLCVAFLLAGIYFLGVVDGLTNMGEGKKNDSLGGETNSYAWECRAFNRLEWPWFLPFPDVEQVGKAKD